VLAKERAKILTFLRGASSTQAEKPRPDRAHASPRQAYFWTAQPHRRSCERAAKKRLERASVNFSAKAARDLMSSRAADREGVGDRCSYAAAFSGLPTYAGQSGGAAGGVPPEERRAMTGWAGDSSGGCDDTFFETEGVKHTVKAMSHEMKARSDVQREGKPRNESTKKRRLSARPGGKSNDRSG
jgi:hypothetical protein